MPQVRVSAARQESLPEQASLPALASRPEQGWRSKPNCTWHAIGTIIAHGRHDATGAATATLLVVLKTATLRWGGHRPSSPPSSPIPRLLSSSCSSPSSMARRKYSSAHHRSQSL